MALRGSRNVDANTCRPIVKLNLPNLDATRYLAHCVAQYRPYPSSIWLCGQLGVGKTAFCRNFIQYFDATMRVKSPTYTILESYRVADISIHHFDFYRIHNPDELEYIGIRECFTEHSVCLIEWPENVGEAALPIPKLRIQLSYGTSEEERCVVLQSSDDSLLAHISESFLE